MSNTSVVSPIESSGAVASAVALCAVAAVAVPVVVARWLSEKTDADRCALDALERSQRRDLTSATEGQAQGSGAGSALSVATTVLRSRDVDRFVAAAERLGFRREPVPAEAGIGSVVLLSSGGGDRIAIARDEAGRTRLHESGAPRLAHAVTRQVTLERVLAHQRSRGLRVEVRDTVDGQTEVDAKGPDGTRVSTMVRRDGSAVVDVDGVCGNRCDGIVRGIATAIDGAVLKTTRKRAYSQPGEPAAVKLRG